MDQQSSKKADSFPCPVLLSLKSMAGPSSYFSMALLKQLQHQAELELCIIWVRAQYRPGSLLRVRPCSDQWRKKRGWGGWGEDHNGRLWSGPIGTPFPDQETLARATSGLQNALEILNVLQHPFKRFQLYIYFPSPLLSPSFFFFFLVL